MKTAIIATVLLTTVLAGCFTPGDMQDDCWRDVEPAGAGTPVGTPAAHDFATNTRTAYADMGFDGTTWPDLHGASVRILDHGAFDYAFEPAKAAFEALTNGTVTHFGADDAGTALQLAVQDRKGGSFDVIYGIDNALMVQAETAGIFAPYTPLLGDRVLEEYRFIPSDGAWLATPVDMGYIAINVDPRDGPTVESLADLVEHADQFVTEDPRFSSPGLGFLIATVAAFGEECYLGFWEDLLDNDVTVTSGWTEAYVDHFSGGYGQWEAGSKSDKTIVTSYTTSPAYEAYYGGDPLNHVLTAPQSTFQQIQTMGILAGTKQRAAAEAWVEFTLTDDFQKLAAEYNAIYPVVSNAEVDASVAAVFGDNDPEPGSFVPATLPADVVGARMKAWIVAWTDLYTAKRA